MTGLHYLRLLHFEDEEYPVSEEVFLDPSQSRSAAVEAAIEQFERLSESDRLQRLRELPCEALVYCLRRMHASRELHNALATELTARVLHMAGAWLRGVTRQQRKQMLKELASDIAVLALTEPVSGKPDGLEIAFGRVLHRRTIDMYRRFVSTRSRHDQLASDADQEDTRAERQLRSLKDRGDSPEKSVMQKVLIEKGLNAIQDPIRREVFRKHYLEGVAVTSKDPSEPTIVREFGISLRTALYWLKQEFETVRRAISGGDQ